MQDPLEDYVAKLLKTKGEPETADSKPELLTKVNDAIDQALVEALPLAQLDKLEEAAKANRADDKLVEQLLGEAGVNPGEVIREALDDFQNEYLKGEA